ncbi:siroheme synthase [Methanocaldococcus villosus KIN24-T80]|uniref:precorrin-2 dehydrogenase n=1 Tax=Methanocaldococcus villosus KIN24-T80 TaxID=1069083 RepID=N6V0V5_9EURY|nr:bifunctional precorrin-2 dehydrogenase/sirohydrochlorin ferrochelatase [Methanocaldococcus villosus]ENN95938.1 siroheme synthase [Methanocaldococcus villosus KIN24-T80]
MLPILLSFENKKVAVFGCGEVGKRRALKILKNGGNVDIYSKNFDNEIKKIKNDRLKLINVDLNKLSDEELREIIKDYDFIVAAVNEEINRRIVKIANELNKFVNASNLMSGVNFILPAYTEVNGVIFSIYTRGKSPMLAKKIRILVENIIRDQDISFLSEFREFLKEIVPNQKDRKKVIEELFNNKEFREELKKIVMRVLNDHSSKS